MEQTNSVNKVLLHIVTSGSHTFYKLTNGDGKVWYLPSSHMDVAFNLYQPSGWKGKLVKALLPKIKEIQFVRDFLHITEHKFSFTDNLTEIFSKYLDCGNDIEFAIFMGTISKTQKITIQLSKGDKILGYAKFSDNPEVISLFNRESQILNDLHSKHIDNVPRSLFIGEVAHGVHMFLQSTIKTNSYKEEHTWGSKQDQFVTALAENTKSTIPFTDSDFYHDIMRLSTQANVLGKDNEMLIKNKIDKVLEYYGNKPVDFSTFHADFTPWNMFVEGDKLFVFDWEFARSSYPSYLDYFHFFMQTSIFEQHKNCDEIISQYRGMKQELTKYFDTPDLSFLCYLLSIISLYVGLHKSEKLSGDVLNNMQIWLKLLSEL